MRQPESREGAGSVNYRENAAIAAHAIRISGDRKDNSHILLYQAYQSECEPAVFFSNRMASVSGVSLFQVFQVFHCFKCFRCARYYGADTEQIAPFNFWSCRVYFDVCC